MGDVHLDMLLTFYLAGYSTLSRRAGKKVWQLQCSYGSGATPKLDEVHRRQMTIRLLLELFKITKAGSDILTWKSDFASYQFRIQGGVKYTGYQNNIEFTSDSLEYGASSKADSKQWTLPGRKVRQLSKRRSERRSSYTSSWRGINH